MWTLNRRDAAARTLTAAALAATLWAGGAGAAGLKPAIAPVANFGGPAAKIETVRRGVFAAQDAAGFACLATQTVASVPKKREHRALADLLARWSLTMRKRHGAEFARISAARIEKQNCERTGAGFVCWIAAQPCRADLAFD